MPLLGDIPGLGRLFRSNSDTLVTRTLIIFIAAKILNLYGNSYE
ncbi:MAG: hypothetical protein CMI18_11860 [Opitutaceae bacterium]|nr:hypothetical protein [Opitutaceae bacterium]